MEKPGTLVKRLPAAECFLASFEPNWIWIQLLELSVHLWSEKVFEEVGEECGG